MKRREPPGEVAIAPDAPRRPEQPEQPGLMTPELGRLVMLARRAAMPRGRLRVTVHAPRPLRRIT